MYFAESTDGDDHQLLSSCEQSYSWEKSTFGGNTLAYRKGNNILALKAQSENFFDSNQTTAKANWTQF